MFKISRLTVSSLLASVALIALAGPSGTAHANHSVVGADFCVDATHFRFMVDLNEPDNEDAVVTLVLGIGADSDGLPSPPTASTEVIGVNFFRDEGEIPGFPPRPPEVESEPVVGAPLNRWMVGLIDDFTITTFGAGSGEFRIEGSVPNGAQPFTAGDTLADIGFEVFDPLVAHDTMTAVAHLSNIPIGACDNQIGENVTLGFGILLGNGIVIEDGAIIGDFTEISDEVFIGENVVIGPNSFLDIQTEIDDDAILGAGCMVKSLINTVFHPATVAKEAQIGDNCDLAGGTDIGRGVMIGENFETASKFTDAAHTDLSIVTVSRGATIHDGVFLDHGTGVARAVVLGDGVSTTTILNTIFVPVVFEQNANVGAGSTLEGGTIVGSGVVLGDNVTTLTDTFPVHFVIFDRNTTVGEGSEFKSGTVVEQGVQIGAFAIVGENVLIEKDAIIGNCVTLADGVIVPTGTTVDGTPLPCE